MIAQISPQGANNFQPLPPQERLRDEPYLVDF